MNLFNDVKLKIFAKADIINVPLQLLIVLEPMIFYFKGQNDIPSHFVQR